MRERAIDQQLYNNYLNDVQDFNSIQFQLDTSEELEGLRAEFLGLEWDEEKQEFVESHHKLPMMNKIGANAILSFLKPRVNKIFSLSYHKSEDIDKRCHRYIDDLSIMLVRHRRLYELLSFAILDNIIDLCDDIFRATALKSLQGWEGDGIRKQQSYVEQKQTIQDNRVKDQSRQFPLALRRR